jgi:hypothetical protein
MGGAFHLSLNFWRNFLFQDKKEEALIKEVQAISDMGF